MTIEELQIAKKFYENNPKNVERIASVYKVFDNINNIVDDIDDSRLKIQYQAAMTDPRRI